MKPTNLKSIDFKFVGFMTSKSVLSSNSIIAFILKNKGKDQI